MFWDLFSNNSEKRKKEKGTAEASLRWMCGSGFYLPLSCQFEILHRKRGYTGRTLSVGTRHRNRRAVPCLTSTDDTCHRPARQERSLRCPRHSGEDEVIGSSPQPGQHGSHPEGCEGSLEGWWGRVENLRFPLKYCQACPPGAGAASAIMSVYLVGALPVQPGNQRPRGSNSPRPSSRYSASVC